MDDQQQLQQIASRFNPDQAVSTGNWFGKPCLKVGGKVFAVIAGAEMAFKLSGADHAEALRLPGACLYDPRGTGSPLRAWVQLPAAQAAHWVRFAHLARATVASAAQTEKDKLMRGLVRARAAIMEAARQIPPTDHDRVFLGSWSLKDLLAHLAGWDDTNREAVQEILAGQKPSFWEFYDHDWVGYNATLVARYRRDNFTQLLDLVEETHQALIAYLESLPADLFLEHSQIRRLLRAEAGDERAHRRQLEELLHPEAPA